jgi:hypothetical protein
VRAFRARLLGSLGEGMIEGENEILGVKGGCRIAIAMVALFN